MDNLIHCNRRWFMDLLNAIASLDGVGIGFVEVRADLLDRQLIDCMAANQVASIACFPESASRRIRIEMNKDYDVDRFMNNIAYASDCGILILGSLMSGWPGETQAEFESTMELASSTLFDAVTLCQLVLLAGSPIGARLSDLGVDADEESYFRYLQDPIRPEYCLTDRPFLSQQEVNALEYEINREKTVRPEVIAKFRRLGVGMIPIPLSDHARDGRDDASGPAAAHRNPDREDLPPAPDTAREPPGTHSGRLLLERMSQDISPLLPSGMSALPPDPDKGQQACFVLERAGNEPPLLIVVSNGKEPRTYRSTRLFSILHHGDPPGQEALAVLDRFCALVETWEQTLAGRLTRVARQRDRPRSTGG